VIFGVCIAPRESRSLGVVWASLCHSVEAPLRIGNSGITGALTGETGREENREEKTEKYYNSRDYVILWTGLS
jgi:hypothetical protein